MRLSANASWTVVLAAVLTIGFSVSAFADRHDTTREERSAQLIFNTAHMSRDAGKPTPELIERYRTRDVGNPDGPQFSGFGQRATVVVDEGERIAWGFGVAYHRDGGVGYDQQMEAVWGSIRYGTDPQTGATMYVQVPEDPERDSSFNVVFILRVDNISLDMAFLRGEKDQQLGLDRSLRRWRFFVSEAKRLGVLEGSNAPIFLIKVWNADEEKWETLQNSGAFTRRLADLHSEEPLGLEVEVQSEGLVPDEPYVFEMQLGKGAEHLRLLDSDGVTALEDSDGNGWVEVRVDPVDGAHPPRPLVAQFESLPDGDESIGQKTVTSFKYEDDTGEARQENVLARSDWIPVITHFELRAKQRSVLAPLRTSIEEFNGEFNKHGDLLLNWRGRTRDRDDTSGFLDQVGIYLNSQRAIAFGDGTIYMGWTKEQTTGLGFWTLEDRVDGPLEIGPLQARTATDLYVDVWIEEDLPESSDPNAANRSPPSPDKIAEDQRFIRERLEIGSRLSGEEFEVSVWHVDDLADLKDDDGKFPGLSQSFFPRIKKGLRRTTGDRVKVGTNLFFEWTPDLSREISAHFRGPHPINDPLLAKAALPLILAPGIYELRLTLTLREKEKRDKQKLVEAALRFWVWDTPGVEEIRPIEGIRTQRQSFRFDADLRDGAQSGDVEQIAAALRAGADIDAVDENGATPLGWAASKGHTEAVRALIRAGADVHAQAAGGQTPLTVAVAQGHDAILGLLIAAGADVNERITGDRAPAHLQGATPLFLATNYDRIGMVEELIRLGADVNVRNQGGATPLFSAAERGNVALVRSLIQAGADVSVQDDLGGTPLMAAANSDSAEMVWLLIDGGAAVDATVPPFAPAPFGGANAVMFAANAGSPRSLLALALAGADLTARNYQGQTALALAEERGNDDVLEILRNPGDLQQLARQTFEEELFDAAEAGKVDYVRLLAKQGVELDARNEDGITPLLRVAEEGLSASVRTLLAAGAAVDAADEEFGATPLMIAAFRGEDEIVRVLLEAGAAPNKTARGNDSGEAAGWTALIAAASEARPFIVSLLLDAGADPMAVDGQGRTARGIAAAGFEDQLRRADNAERGSESWKTATEKAIAYKEIETQLMAALRSRKSDREEAGAVTWDFETGDLAGWQRTGDAFENQPTFGDNPTARGRGMPSAHQGDYWIGGYENRPSPADPAGGTSGDGPTGTLTSPAFKIHGPTMSFLIGGGCDENAVRAELLVDGQVARVATGACSETMERVEWNVSPFDGQSARVRLVDDSAFGWGHINFDDIRF